MIRKLAKEINKCYEDAVNSQIKGRKLFHENRHKCELFFLSDEYENPSCRFYITDKSTHEIVRYCGINSCPLLKKKRAIKRTIVENIDLISGVRDKDLMEWFKETFHKSKKL